MKVDIIIIPEEIHQSMYKNTVEVIKEKFEKATNNEVQVKYNLNKVENLDGADFHLLFYCEYEEFEIIKPFSKKIVLVDFVCSQVKKIIDDYDFAGIICSRYFCNDLPIIFGFPEIAKKMKIASLQISKTNTAKYVEIIDKGSTPIDLLISYLKALHDENQSQGRL